MTTLREIHERCKTRHERAHPDSNWCKTGCGTSPWPCPDYRDAVAALAILNAAKVTVTFFDYGELPHEAYRVVPDPEPTA